MQSRAGGAGERRRGAFDLPARAIDSGDEGGPPAESFTSAAVYMDTLVSIEVVNPPSHEACAQRAAAAFGWFREVEQRCSRFDPGSELSRLSATVGVPMTVSPMLFMLVDFALSLARESNGAFDPTVGHAMELRGFDRNFRTGDEVVGHGDSDLACSYRDVALDRGDFTVTISRPMVLDLGAVAKGFAIDLAAETLSVFDSFAVYAGGDVYVRGRNPAGEPWRIGIRHPREPGSIVETLHVSDVAVCTSGDYERRQPGDETGHHIIEPRTGASANNVASATAVAPTAMLADALATAAFVLGPARGIELLERHGTDGVVILPTLERFESGGFSRLRP